MKTILSFLLLLLLSLNNHGQEFSQNFKTMMVNKKLSEFPDRFDLSSPLNSFITFNYTLINGKNHLFQAICSAKRKSELPDSAAADSQIVEDVKNRSMNVTINEIVLYKDSVAFVISEYDNYYSIRSFYLELGKWVNNGEDLGKSIDKARKLIQDLAELFYADLQDVYARFLAPPNQ